MDKNLPTFSGSSSREGSPDIVPSMIYFWHPETEHYEYGVIENQLMGPSEEVTVKDALGNRYLALKHETFMITKWRIGTEVNHIHSLGASFKAFVAADLKSTESQILISRHSFEKYVKPEELKFSQEQMERVVQRGDATSYFNYLYQMKDGTIQQPGINDVNSVSDWFTFILWLMLNCVLKN